MLSLQRAVLDLIDNWFEIARFPQDTLFRWT